MSTPTSAARGYSAHLHDEVIRQARAAGDVVGVRLYVERDNKCAQATYESLGMHDARYVVMELML